MLLNQIPNIIADREALKQFMYVTVNGKLIPKSNEDYMKLCLLAYRFKQAVKYGINLILKGVPQKEAYKELAKLLPSSIYGETAYKYAKLLVKGSNGEKINVRKKWLASRGGVTWKGNLNIKLILTDKVLIRYYGGEWLKFNVRFGRKYLPLIKELILLANQKKISYGVSISFNNDKPYIHVEIPLRLYLKHLSTSKPEGYGLIAGYDLNSDRLNAIVINGNGDIVALKSYWYSKVISHGFSKDKARWLRLNALSSFEMVYEDRGRLCCI